MAAPKGNRFWEARSSHGRDKLFTSPDVLLAACIEYFEWVEENPLYESKPFAYQGVVVQESVPKMRAMTIGGLCNFLGIHVSTWDEYRKSKDFSAVCMYAEQTMRQQKFEGASADMLNVSIIARDLGLTDRHVTEVTGKDGAALIPDISPQEMARRVAFILASGMED